MAYPRLQKRRESGIYYFRVAVPKDLTKQIGRKELKVSLRTADIRHAREMVVVQSSKVNQEFSRMRGEIREYPAIELPINPVRPVKSPTLEDVINRYVSAPERQKVSEKTKRDYSSAPAISCIDYKIFS